MHLVRRNCVSTRVSDEGAEIQSESRSVLVLVLAARAARVPLDLIGACLTNTAINGRGSYLLYCSSAVMPSNGELLTGHGFPDRLRRSHLPFDIYHVVRQSQSGDRPAGRSTLSVLADSRHCLVAAAQGVTFRHVMCYTSLMIYGSSVMTRLGYLRRRPACGLSDAILVGIELLFSRQCSTTECIPRQTACICRRITVIGREGYYASC